MSVDLPSDPALHDERLSSLEDRDLAERLASLEDPDLAERLFLENPALFSDGPPQTERQVLAWTTRRFGTLVLAVTAAASIAAGYLLTPLMRDRSPAATEPVQRTTISVPVSAALAHRAIPPTHHVVRLAPVPKHVAAHRHAAAPHAAVQAHEAVPHTVYAPRVVPAVPHPHRIVRRAPVAPAPAEHEAVLREKIRAQQAEIARLQAQAAAEAAAAHAARVRAAQAAAQTQARPRTASTSRPGAGTANVPVDTTAGPPDSGVRTPPAPPRGGWSEHPPIPGPLGGVLGPRDSCTPSGGRMGAVINAILDSGLVRTNIRL